MLFQDPVSNLTKTKWRIKNGGHDFVNFGGFARKFVYIYIFDVSDFKSGHIFFFNKMADPIWRPNFLKVKPIWMKFGMRSTFSS